jgi:MFS transporter, AAHS family, 3-hydroxyphenylpropionic acid transporter
MITRTESIPKSETAMAVALCFFVAVLEGFDIQAIGIAGPRLAPEFGLSPPQLGWVFSVSNIGLVIGSAFGGWLADRTGRKPILVAAVAIFGVFTLLTTLSGNFQSLILVRFCTGLGFGAALPNMMAIAAEISSPHRRASTAAAMFSGLPLGGGMCALVTQFLPHDFDWRTLFLIGGLLPVLLVPALYLRLPETLVRGAMLHAPRTELGQVLFGDGRGPSTLLLWLAFLPTLLILYLILNWLPTLVAANGLDRAVAPQASIAFNFGSVPGALLCGWLADRIGARWPLTLAYVGLSASLVALSASKDLAAILILSGAVGFFLLGANYALYGIAATYYPQSMRGTGSGAAVAVGRAGSIIGPALAGVLLGGGMSAMGVVQTMVPFAAVAAIAVFLVSLRPRASE